MSSTYKTDHLHLNNWTGADKPQRVDFNNDNQRIDSAVYAHTSNETVHVSTAEKEKWNAPYFIGTYMGNGAGLRTITTNCPFTPNFGMVFAAGKLPMMNDYQNEAHYNYFGLFSVDGSVNGVSLEETQLKVIQSPTAIFGSEYRNFNESGTHYIYILFR